jgi:hypothetical protein
MALHLFNSTNRAISGPTGRGGRITYPAYERSYETLAELRRNYAAHMTMLTSRGLDPMLIGEHEVQPVRCDGCGEAIPWRKVKGYRN